MWDGFQPPHKSKLFGCEILRFKSVVVSCLPKCSAFNSSGVASNILNSGFLLFSSLASRTLWLNFSPSLFLLWCWAFRGKNHCRSLLFFGVASSVKSAASLPALLGCLFFWGELMFSYSLTLRFLQWISQRRIFLLWHWKSRARNHRRSLHFAGVRLFNSRFNSVDLFVRNPFSGWKMNACVTRQAAGEMKKYRGEIELLALFSGGCFTTAIRIAK